MSETRRTVLRTRIDVLQKAGKSIGEGIGNFLQVFGCIMAERLTTQEMLMQRNSPPALSPVVQKPEEAQEPEVPTPPIPVTPVKVRAKRVNIGTKKFYHMGAPMPRPT